MQRPPAEEGGVEASPHPVVSSSPAGGDFVVLTFVFDVVLQDGCMAEPGEATGEVAAGDEERTVISGMDSASPPSSRGDHSNSGEEDTYHGSAPRERGRRG
jgi:hypothetical protein